MQLPQERVRWLRGIGLSEENIRTIIWKHPGISERCRRFSCCWRCCCCFARQAAWPFLLPGLLGSWAARQLGCFAAWPLLNSASALPRPLPRPAVGTTPKITERYRQWLIEQGIDELQVPHIVMRLPMILTYGCVGAIN